MKLHSSKLVSCFVITSLGVVIACSGDGSIGSSENAVTSSCKTASDCHGALPDLCEVCSGGGSGCAHWECESGKCEIGYCPKPECTTASDCHGALPDICERCSGGGSECAHWECESGKCETVICN